MEKNLLKTSLEDQSSQVSAFFGFLDGTTLVILRINEGNQVHVAPVNVPKTHLVKVVHCASVGSIPIGATPTQVDGNFFYMGMATKSLGHHNHYNYHHLWWRRRQWQ